MDLPLLTLLPAPSPPRRVAGVVGDLHSVAFGWLEARCNFGTNSQGGLGDDDVIVRPPMEGRASAGEGEEGESLWI